VTLGGFRGTQFDGKVTGKEKTFIPFTPPSNVARYYGDANYLDKGEAFRIIVLNVRHKVVAIFIETGGLPPADSAAFVERANTMLASLRFPG
jgi:hypothetical protein